MNWKIQEMQLGKWQTRYTGNKTDIRKQFGRLLFRRGRRRMLDECDRTIAKAGVEAIEVEIEVIEEGGDRND